MPVLMVVFMLAVAPGITDEAKKQYADASAKLRDGDYAHANDVLNGLAGAYPHWPELFASRCSAQLGLRHWDAAAADCTYALQLKPKLPTAVYGLGVAEDGRRHYPEAVRAYRDYAALGDSDATLKKQALQRADMLAAKATATPAATAAPTPAVSAPPVLPVSAPVRGNFLPGIPSSGRLLLYVFRNLSAGVGTPATVFVDDKSAGPLPNATYLELDLLPGKHTVTVKAPGEKKEAIGSWTMDFGEGDVLYLKLERAPQGNDEAFRPVQVTGDVARREIRANCSLSASSRL